MEARIPGWGTCIVVALAVVALVVIPWLDGGLRIGCGSFRAALKQHARKN